jgi:hypothetical protein
MTHRKRVRPFPPIPTARLAAMIAIGERGERGAGAKRGLNDRAEPHDPCEDVHPSP